MTVQTAFKSVDSFRNGKVLKMTQKNHYPQVFLIWNELGVYDLNLATLRNSSADYITGKFVYIFLITYLIKYIFLRWIDKKYKK